MAKTTYDLIEKIMMICKRIQDSLAKGYPTVDTASIVFLANIYWPDLDEEKCSKENIKKLLLKYLETFGQEFEDWNRLEDGIHLGAYAFYDEDPANWWGDETITVDDAGHDEYGCACTITYDMYLPPVFPRFLFVEKYDAEKIAYALEHYKEE